MLISWRRCAVAVVTQTLEVHILRRILALVVFACLTSTVFFALGSLASIQKWIIVEDLGAGQLDPSNYYIKNFALTKNFPLVIGTYSQSEPGILGILLEFSRVDSIQADKVKASCAIYELLSAQSGRFEVKLTQAKITIWKSDLLFKTYLDRFKNRNYSLDYGQAAYSVCRSFDLSKDITNFSRQKIIVKSGSTINQYGEKFVIKLQVNNKLVATSIQ
jgi:hypothetical protein